MASLLESQANQLALVSMSKKGQILLNDPLVTIETDISVIVIESDTVFDILEGEVLFSSGLTRPTFTINSTTTSATASDINNHFGGYVPSYKQLYGRFTKVKLTSGAVTLIRS